MAKRATCTGTQILDIVAECMYGRRICATCGNSGFLNKDGSIRRHTAMRISEVTRVACGITFTPAQEFIFAANQG